MHPADHPADDYADWREDCAPRRVLDLFATKWTSMILHSLHVRHAGAARTGVLLRSLPGISKKMLTQTLREMEASGLVTRHVQGTIPPAVDYRLSPLGRRFVEPVELLYAWGRDNADALVQLGHRPTSRRRWPDEAIAPASPDDPASRESPGPIPGP